LVSIHSLHNRLAASDPFLMKGRAAAMVVAFGAPPLHARTGPQAVADMRNCPAPKIFGPLHSREPHR
jgi:hypothetical protein